MATWTAAQVRSDEVSKKMILAQLQEHAEAPFLAERKLNGAPNAVLKRVTKDFLAEAYIKHAGLGAAASSEPAAASKPAATAESKPAAAGGFKFEAAAATDAAPFKFSPDAAAAKPATPTSPAFSFSPPQTAATSPGFGNMFANAPAAAAGSSPAFQFNFAAGASPAAGASAAPSAPAGDGDDEEMDVSAALRKRMQELNMSASARRDAILAELPQAVRSRVEKLEELQESTDVLQKEFDEKLKALQNEYEAKKAPLYKERFTIVQGAPGVPNFWLRTLQNHMMLAEEMQEFDEPVLAHLVDVKYTTNLGPGKAGFQLAFNFTENAFFENNILTKTYLLDPDDEDECLQKAIGTDIKWKEGQNVCVKIVEKKQKKKGKTRTVKVEEPTDSFFNFFDPPDVPDEEDEMDEEEAEALHEQLENDYEIGCIIKDKIVPRAVSWFTGVAIDPEDEYDDDDEEEDDDDEDEEDDDDEEEEEDDDDDDDDDEDDDHVDTSKPRAVPGAGPGGEDPECKQQ
jgi:nucleosome assembly protein 1-like 1